MIIKGDVNGDGRITIEDVLLIRAYLLEQITLTGDVFLAADINNNGLVTISDASNINFHRTGQRMINEVIY